MRRRASRVGGAFAVAVLGLSAGTAAANAETGHAVPASQRASAASGQLKWRVAYVPHIANGLIEGITAPSRSAVWVFGQTVPKHGASYRFLLHWNGTRWRKSGLPVTGFRPLIMGSSAAANVWLIGVNQAKAPQALRWNGRRWLRVAGPTLASLGLQAVTVISPTDVWVGVGIDTEHWNGSTWTKIALPAGFEFQQLASSSASNVWVAGTMAASGRLAAYRWRSGAWVKVGTPNLTPLFVGLAVQSPKSVWVTAVTVKSQRLLHWTGAGPWHSVPDRAGFAEFPLAPYSRAGVWVSPTSVWTGRSNVAATYPVGGGSVLPLALAAVPGSTSAWLAAQTGLDGPTILRT